MNFQLGCVWKPSSSKSGNLDYLLDAFLFESAEKALLYYIKLRYA